ncbi:Phytosulfokines 5 [Hordeum vulgare]|nr:Phytosulfokines 5 [Hordeum vulgare]
MMAVEAADAAAWAAAKKEAICFRILKKRRRRNTCALSREQNRVVHEIVGLPPKEVSDDEDNSGDKHTRLDPYLVFDRYFHEKDDKGSEGQWQS